MIEDCSGVDMKVLTDLPYRRGITSLSDKGSDEVEDLSLPGCQLHIHLLMEDTIHLFSCQGNFNSLTKKFIFDMSFFSHPPSLS
jgi:hypothetical protein